MCSQFSKQTYGAANGTPYVDLVGKIMQKKEEEMANCGRFKAAKRLILKIPICYDDDEDCIPLNITRFYQPRSPLLSHMEGTEHLDTYSGNESDESLEFIVIPPDDDTSSTGYENKSKNGNFKVISTDVFIIIEAQTKSYILVHTIGGKSTEITESKVKTPTKRSWCSNLRDGLSLHATSGPRKLPRGHHVACHCSKTDRPSPDPEPGPNYPPDPGCSMAVITVDGWSYGGSAVVSTLIVVGQLR
ncbi:hypothetical protein Tco_0973621 [Tanacetum coccineum]